MKNRAAAAFIVLFFIAFGISVGAFTEVMMDVTQKEEIAGYLNNAISNDGESGVDRRTAFEESLKQNGVLVLLMFASGVFVIGFPVAIGALVFKCAAIGFSSALLIEQKGVDGIFTIFSQMIVQNIVFLPVLSFITLLTIDMSLRIIMSTEKRLRKRIYVENMKFYFFMNVIGFLFICLGCFVEAYITPILFFNL